MISGVVLVRMVSSLSLVLLEIDATVVKLRIPMSSNGWPRTTKSGYGQSLPVSAGCYQATPPNFSLLSLRRHVKAMLKEPEELRRIY